VPRANTASGGFQTVVAGDFSFTNGSIYGLAFARSTSFTNVNSCCGCISTGLTPPIDFAALYSDAMNESSYLYRLAPTGSAVLSFGNLYLTGSGTGSMEIFQIDALQMSNASTLNIANLASDAAVVINVAGSGSVLTGGGQLQLNGSTAHTGNDVLFNFASSISSISLYNGCDASILAPNANVVGSYGEFNGDLVAAGYTGSNQFQINPFDAAVPTPTAEPNSFNLIAGVALTIIGMWGRGPLKSLGASFKRAKSK